MVVHLKPAWKMFVSCFIRTRTCLSRYFKGRFKKKKKGIEVEKWNLVVRKCAFKKKTGKKLNEHTPYL